MTASRYLFLATWDTSSKSFKHDIVAQFEGENMTFTERIVYFSEFVEL